MRLKFMLFILYLISFAVWGNTTPLDTPLKDDGTVTIEVDLKKADVKVKPGIEEFIIEGTYHYKVYVPAGYSTNKDRKYFCLFIASPGGNAELGNVKNWVKNKEWIVVMLVESKNGPWGPIISNFLAAHDDAMKRLRIQPGFKFGTGFSGGARASSGFPAQREGFAGVILQGAGFGFDGINYRLDSVNANKNLTVYAIIGSKDENVKEIDWLDKQLPAFTTKKLVTTDTGHQWAAEEEMTKALDWTLSQSLQKARMTEENKTFLLQYREAQYKQATALPTGLEKLNQLEELLAFVKLNKISALGEEADIQNKLTTQITELKKDSGLQNELNAQKTFTNLKATEENIRSKVKDKKMLTSQLTPIVQQYLALGKKYPDTEFGKKALEIGEAIKKEFAPEKK